MKVSQTQHVIGKTEAGERYEIAVDISAHNLAERYDLAELDNRAIARALIQLAERILAA